MQYTQFFHVFEKIGEAFNSPMDTVDALAAIAETLVKQLDLMACHFRLVSRDQRILEHVAAYGLSEEFLNKGPVDAERSVAAALRGDTVMVEDCSNDSRIQYPVEFAKEGIVSLLTVPLKTRGQVIGVMRLFTSERREYSADELEIIGVVATFCTSAITHSMFHRILKHVSESIRSSLEPDEVLNSIVRVVAEDIRAKGSMIQLLDQKGKHLEIRAAFELSERYLEKAATEPDKIVAEAMKGECVTVLDARQDPRIIHLEEVVHEGFSSILHVPLMFAGKALGVLSLFTYYPYHFSDDEIHLMMSIGEQCALAIRNAQMYAGIQRRYENVVDEFHQWFEHYQAHPNLA